MSTKTWWGRRKSTAPTRNRWGCSLGAPEWCGSFIGRRGCSVHGGWSDRDDFTACTRAPR